MIYDYARVSTDGQGFQAQTEALTTAGAQKIFREVASGARSDRPQPRKAVAQLEAGDVLIVTRLDRLARSARDLLMVLDQIAARDAAFRSIEDNWADTTTTHGRLMVTVLPGLAEFERELISARTSEGLQRAQAAGVRMGRKPKTTPHQRREAIQCRDRGNETVAQIASSYNVSHSTISRLSP